MHLSLSALIIRFLMGGSAVLACTLVARKLGEKAGGIFAAFPAVYLAALLTIGLDFHGGELITHSIIISKGAIFGMAINILVAIIAGYLLPKIGWKRGIIHSMACWFVVSIVVVFITSH
ncbi:DUF3147 family protein [Neobacillus ginsengisoli]|uniref:Membrane protein (GlpM family) n=1 Tax=Neobacillus ginsengisoli TaxID=904295 RepID=A0ABT9XW57_9BACI|nr:DUF3147 family protein [Neobacillus ginsengisoli]MDQ0199618.1 putative membrane protein (GlpM family) [Neobacillus ginsengisoli]